MKRSADKAEAADAGSEQLDRLRQILELMALETGSSALGAARPFTDPRPPHARDARPLPSPADRDPVDGADAA